MNTKGEKIQIEEITKSCREFNPKETLALLKADFWRFATWGASKFLVDNMTHPRMLRMYVRGQLHKGHVYIVVNGLDLYDVYIVTTQGTIKDMNENEGIYFDDLFDWIDRKIERIPEYVR